jgi:hypothetical protein
MARALWRHLVREETRYADRASGSGFVQMYGELFRHFRAGCRWFGAAELAHHVLLGAVRGAVPFAAQRGSCVAPTVAAVVVAAATLMLALMLRPHNSVLEACASYVESSLLLVGCVLVLAEGGAATAAFLTFEMYVDVATAVVPFAADAWSVRRLLLRRCRHGEGVRRRVSSGGRVRSGAGEREGLRLLVGLICSGRVARGEALAARGDPRMALRIWH